MCSILIKINLKYMNVEFVILILDIFAFLNDMD